jgi:hypothetical protein
MGGNRFGEGALECEIQTDPMTSFKIVNNYV